MDPSENYKKLNDATKVVDLYAAAQDKQEFMDQLVADKFLVKDPNLSRTANIWEHFGVFSSTNTPEFSFGKEYGRIFSNYKVPNKLFWKNYVGQIQDYLGYLASVRAQIAQFKDGATDQLIRVYGERSGLTAEQIAYLQNLQGQQKADFIDQIIKGLEPKKTQFFGSGGRPLGKGITGAQSPYTITTHPTATPEEHQKLQELGLEERHEPQPLTTLTGEVLTSAGTVNTGKQFLTNEQGERLNTAGPIREPETLVRSNGEPFKASGRAVLLGPDEKPLSTGMETFQASKTPDIIVPGQKSQSLARRILTSSPARDQAQYELEMGLIKGVPAFERAAKEFGGEILKEVGSVPAFSREPQETVVYDTPQETTYTSTGGGRFSPGGRNIRVVRNIPRTIRRTKKGITGARLASTGIKQIATKNPYSILLAVVLIILGLFTVGMVLDTSNVYKNTALCGPDVPCGKGGIPDIVTTSTLLTVFKGGDDKVENGADITYNITVEYVGPGTASIDLNDAIPSNTSFDPAKQFPSFTGTFNSGNVNWHFDNLSINKPIQVFLVLTPTCQDCYVDNTATAIITKSSFNYGSGKNLMPAPLPDPPPNWDAIIAQVGAAAAAHPDVIVGLQEAEAITGVPWQFMFGIFWTETGGGISTTKSVTNGFPLADSCFSSVPNHCDIPADRCAAGAPQGQGLPIPHPGGGCTFATFLDSAIYEGRHAITINKEQPIVTFFDAVRTASLYNGGGNANCGESPPTIYERNGNCNGSDALGRDFPGEDDPYAMADFDLKHYDQGMQLLWCGNKTPCPNVRIFGRPGVMAIVRAITVLGATP